jgi:hypothetical protein
VFLRVHAPLPLPLPLPPGETGREKETLCTSALAIDLQSLCS